MYLRSRGSGGGEGQLRERLHRERGVARRAARNELRREAVDRVKAERDVERPAPPRDLVDSARDPARVARLGRQHGGRGGEVRLGGDVLRGAGVRGHANALERLRERGEGRGGGVWEVVSARGGRVFPEGLREEGDVGR